MNTSSALPDFPAKTTGNKPTKRDLTKHEARQLVEMINEHIDRARALLLELYERKGWIALGYSSWRECVTAEFRQSQATLYRQLQAAQTEMDISQNEKNATLGQIPESQLRPLAALDTPQEKREAWNEANETAPSSGLTASHVKETVEKLRGVTSSKNPLKAVRNAFKPEPKKESDPGPRYVKGEFTDPDDDERYEQEIQREFTQQGKQKKLEYGRNCPCCSAALFADSPIPPFRRFVAKERT